VNFEGLHRLKHLKLYVPVLFRKLWWDKERDRDFKKQEARWCKLSFQTAFTFWLKIMMTNISSLKKHALKQN